MALETRHHNQSSPQSITNNRELLKIEKEKPNNSVPVECISSFATTMKNPWLGLNHQFPGINNMMIPQTNFVNIESELSNNLQNDPRKRSRESTENQFNNLNMPPVTNNVLIQDFAPQSNLPYDVQQDIDYILSKFNKNFNLELETQEERDVKFMLAKVTSKFVKKVRTQSEQISKMAKQIIALQERTQSLDAETQLWKNKANTAEITVMSLRKEFDKILGKVSELNAPTKAVVVEEDAESCCGSTDSGNNYQEATRNTVFIDRNKMCKKCGERESSVLVLPCRHLCLCSVCGGSVKATCPVCYLCIATTVHVCLT